VWGESEQNQNFVGLFYHFFPGSLSQTSRDRPPCQCTFSRAAANERGGGEPVVRAVDAVQD